MSCPCYIFELLFTARTRTAQICTECALYGYVLLIHPTSFLSPLTNAHASNTLSYVIKSTSLAADVKGKTPIFSKVLKAVSAVRGAASNILPGPRHSVNSLVLGDQDAVVHEIAFHHRRIAMKPPPTKDEDVQENPTEDVDKAHFSYIITRPTAFLKDGPSTRTVSASKSVSRYLRYF